LSRPADPGLTAGLSPGGGVSFSVLSACGAGEGRSSGSCSRLRRRRQKAAAPRSAPTPAAAAASNPLRPCGFRQNLILTPATSLLAEALRRDSVWRPAGHSGSVADLVADETWRLSSQSCARGGLPARSRWRAAAGRSAEQGDRLRRGRVDRRTGTSAFGQCGCLVLPTLF
jgi:hypothetical protein